MTSTELANMDEEFNPTSSDEPIIAPAATKSSPLDIDEHHLDNSNVKIKNYTLNQRKCLEKKRNHCDRPFINFIPRDSGRQLKIECSSGCYELLKAEILETTVDDQISEKFSIVFSKESVHDMKGCTPEIIIKASHRLVSGHAGKRTKFTINMYNTQCSMLINGNCTSTFQDEILPSILERVANRPEMNTLDKFYAQVIDRCLKTSIENPDMQVSLRADASASTLAIETNNNNCKDAESETPCTPLSVVQSQNNTSTDTYALENISLNTCVHCRQDVEDGIACDNCSQWNHFRCELLDSAFVKFYNEGDVPYSCLSCRQLTMQADPVIRDLTLDDEKKLTQPNRQQKITKNQNSLQIEPNISRTVIEQVAPPVGQETVSPQQPPLIDNEPTENTKDTSCKMRSDEKQLNDHKKCKSNKIYQANEKSNGKLTTSSENIGEIQQQLDLAISTIKKHERKLDEYDRVNKGQQAKKNLLNDTKLPMNNELLNRINQLETELLKTRISNLEQTQQLSLQIQTLSMANNVQKMASNTVPPFSMYPNPKLVHFPFPPPVHFPPPPVMTRQQPANRFPAPNKTDIGHNNMTQVSSQEPNSSPNVWTSNHNLRNGQRTDPQETLPPNLNNIH